MTLRRRLTLAFVLVVLTPLLVGLLAVAKALPRAVSVQQRAGVAASAKLVGQVLQDYCLRAEVAAESVGRAATSPQASAVRVAARSLVARHLADGVRVLGPDRRVAVAVGPVPAGARDCGSGPSRVADGSAVSAVVELTTADGRPAGTSVASFGLESTVLPMLLDSVAGDLALVDADGRVVVASGGLTSSDVARARQLDQAGNERVSGWSAAGLDQPFGVALVQARAKGPALARDATVVVAVAILLAVVIGVVSARATTRPLAELSGAAARVASGDLSTMIAVRSRDELGRLATSFNAMTLDLRSYVGQLQASRAELQAGLARLGDTLSSTHDLDRILAVVLESAMASTRAESGMVLLLTPSRAELVLAASRGLDVPVDLRLAVGEGLSGQVALTGDPVRGFTGDRPGELRPGPSEPAGTAVIAVPLKSNGTVIGVLDLYGSPAVDGFGEDDLATIRTFATQATVAVDNVLLHEEAQRLSITDGLTGLWNYRYFTMTVSKEIERAARFDRPLALLMLDLDHFKNVNDTFGHQRGDAVLVELAARIRGCVRDVDTVARYGGEEIVVILPETDEPGAGQLADRICEAVRRKSFGGPGEHPVPLTISAGVAVFPINGTSATLLLARADEALYAAKDGGRDQWRLSLASLD